ncbi:hypothetical protein L6E12_09270 [Actinokineospora sp. PR83]|uniref:CocE/NonD family hydrolase n=1 Tax=Actinokineospora sp. PR83 TaxID=2884908 RepID=UPI0027DF6B03|nr:CocE/NonD family hydrolase [Actinokineospora sp. PR83]MCG8915978.1 hypothetical protein [Actinokineospora sp. PR83]
MRGRLVRVAVAALAVLGLAFAVPTGGPASALGFDAKLQVIPVEGGVSLEALVLRPWGSGPHPLVVFISPWSMDWTQNTLPAVTLANKGYTVVSYVTRGFKNSGGEVGVASPTDVRDTSTVIDWSLANTASDATRIGVYGLSYGAGMGILAAAKDDRIKAVTALSGWYDLPASFARDGVRSASAGKLLHDSGRAGGRLSAETDLRLRQVVDPALSDADYADLVAWAEVRSPKTYLAELNANKPAILIEQAWGETAFPPGPMLDFYNAYRGPKRVEFRPGDHATPEIPALMGLPTGVLDPVYRWLDAYVAGTDRSITTEPDLQYTPRPVARGTERYTDTTSAFGTPKRYRLTENALTTSTATGPAWSRSIATDTDSAVSGGQAMVTGTLQTFLLEPSPIDVSALDRAVAAVWSAEPTWTATTRIRGAAALHLPYTPSAARGTLVAYLLDIDHLGKARIIGYAPHAWANAAPGRPRAADFAFQPTAYDLDPGHRLSVVVDGKDTLFVDANQPGSGVTLTSAGGAHLDLPVK